MNIQVFNRVYGIGLFFVLLVFNDNFGKINFGATTSEIFIDDMSTLDVSSNAMTVQQGTINRSNLGVITGNAITFDRGVFTSFNSVSDLSGAFNPAGSGTIVLSQNINPNAIDIMIANAGGLSHKLLINPGEQFLRGDPLFFDPNAITLTDATTLLAIAVQNTLNTNITMNGGILFLEDDLRLGNEAVLLGDGLVFFNNRRMSLGGAASVWNGTINWISGNMSLNGPLTLNGVWFFFGDSQINGNGNVLDITGGGIIFITPGATLRLAGTVLKGLGSGALFMGESAQLRLSDSDIVMNTDYTVDSGGIYVDGDSTIITQNNLLRITDGLDSHGSLTVDSVALTYDTQNFLDNINIRPQQINDPDHKYINIINNGSIRRIRQEPITFYGYSAGSAVQRYAIVNPQRVLQIFPQIDPLTDQLQYDFTINASFNFFGFTPANSPIMFVSDKVHVKYKNVYFRDFSPLHLSLGKHSKLIFGNNSTVGFSRNETLNYRFSFEGNTILDGAGDILTLEPGGEIVLQGKHGTLLINSLTIKGLSGNNIRCNDPTSKIIFKDVTLYQDDDFSFDVGAIQVLNNVTLIGPFDFIYTATGPFTVLPDSTLNLLRNKRFTYAPANGNRFLLQMSDPSSTINIDTATLSAPAPGLQLLGGRLIENNRNFLQNAGGTNVQNGIVFGNNTCAGNVIIQQNGGASLELQSGFFDNQTIAPC